MPASKTSHLVAAVLVLAFALSSFSVMAMNQPSAHAASATTTGTGRWVGFYVPGAPASLSPLTALESRVGQKAAVSNYFQSVTQGFTSAQASNAANHGSIPLITLEFWNPAYGVNQPSYSLQAVANGKFDSYLHTYARNAKAFGRTVWLRPFHEFNGNWYPWGYGVNGNSPRLFGTAWRRVKGIFAAEGATNVKFVWCPNADNSAGAAIANYWPGESAVDLIAIDGYNFGTSKSWSSWRSFGSVFGPAYTTVTRLSATKPVFIAETGCSPVGGNKATWISDMFNTIPTRYPRIRGVVWFNANKETDWRVESASGPLAAYSSGATRW